MRHLMLLVLTSILALTFVPGFAAAAAPSGEARPTVQDDDRYEMEGCVSKTEFTAKQKQKLEKLFDRQYENMKALLDAYEEFGAITPDQKEHRLSMVQEHMEMVKKNGYRWCHEIEREDFD